LLDLAPILAIELCLGQALGIIEPVLHNRTR
jgi:hypothetical protein